LKIDKATPRQDRLENGSESCYETDNLLSSDILFQDQDKNINMSNNNIRDFSDCTRIVIKIGTNTLSKGPSIDIAFVRDMASQIQSLFTDGKQIVIVTSGAIGMGAGRLGLEKRPEEVRDRQACAAIGQPLLMHEYQMAFAVYNIPVAQVLLTAEVFTKRTSYLNLRNAMDTLLERKVIPIINENDVISTAEIGSAFGDNDTLSALVASKINADLLLFLTDIDALYDKDPRKFPDARPIPLVNEITKEIEEHAGDSGSKHATGGMKTKIKAARIVSHSGCKLLLANGRESNILLRVLAGEGIGTLFMPKRKLNSRSRWILTSVPAGEISVDDGALQALKQHKSLLPSGIVAVCGKFDAGSVISINKVAKAVTSMNSEEIQQLMGKHSSEIRKTLGAGRRDVVAPPEDIILLDE
jgi:glutamate 5-kinase